MAKAPPSFGVLLKAMNSRDPEEAENAFYTVLREKDRFGSEILAAAAREAKPPLACWLLELSAALGTDRATDVIVSRVTDDNPRIRECARSWLASVDTRYARIAAYRLKHLH